jgi:hypothetical protein
MLKKKNAKNTYFARLMTGGNGGERGLLAGITHK